MKMKIEVYENKSTIVTDSVLKAFTVEKNLWVFSLLVTPNKPTSTGTFKINRSQLVSAINRQGFVDDKNYELLKAGKSYKTLDFCIMPLTTQELMRKNGWSALQDICKNNDGWYDNENAFDKMQANTDPDTVVQLDSASHMLWDRHGKPLPVGIDFDYISHGGITDGRYDLPKLAKHLLKRKDIIVYPIAAGSWSDRVDRDSVAKTVEECIADIPYYNSERGSSKTIYFTWQPTVADYRRMWAECIAKKAKYPSTYMHQAIFDLDLLGVRKAGAALFDDYHDSTRYQRDSYED